MDEMKIVDVVEAICKRPPMYTLNGTFGEVFAFLDGYAYGARVGSAYKSSSYFLEFQQWLYQKLGHPEMLGDRWQSFLSAYPDEAAAIADFARYWRDYVNEVGITDSVFGSKPR